MKIEDLKGIELSEDLFLHDDENEVSWKKDVDDWFNVAEDYKEIGEYLYNKCLTDTEPVLGKEKAEEITSFFKHTLEAFKNRG